MTNTTDRYSMMTLLFRRKASASFLTMTETLISDAASKVEFVVSVKEQVIWRRSLSPTQVTVVQAAPEREIRLICEVKRIGVRYRSIGAPERAVWNSVALVHLRKAVFRHPGNLGIRK